MVKFSRFLAEKEYCHYTKQKAQGYKHNPEPSYFSELPGYGEKNPVS